MSKVLAEAPCVLCDVRAEVAHEAKGGVRMKVFALVMLGLVLASADANAGVLKDKKVTAWSVRVDAGDKDDAPIDEELPAKEVRLPGAENTCFVTTATPTAGGKFERRVGCKVSPTMIVGASLECRPGDAKEASFLMAYVSEDGPSMFRVFLRCGYPVAAPALGKEGPKT